MPPRPAEVLRTGADPTRAVEVALAARRDTPDRAEVELDVEPRSLVVLPGEDVPVDLDQIGWRILQTEKQTLLNHFNVGMWLTQVHNQLRHGEWQTFLEKYFPYGIATARRRMALYELINKRQRILSALGDIGVNKVRALLELPEEDIQAIEETGHVGELSLIEIRDVPYRELRAQLEAVSTERARLKEAQDAAATAHTSKVAELTESLNKANSRIAALTEEPAPSEREGKVLTLLETAARNLELHFNAFHGALRAAGELLAEAAEDRDYAGGARVRQGRPIVTESGAAKMVARAEWVGTMGEHHRLYFRQLAGLEVSDDVYARIVAKAAKLAAGTDNEDLQIPAGNILPFRDGLG